MNWSIWNVRVLIPKSKGCVGQTICIYIAAGPVERHSHPWDSFGHQWQWTDAAEIDAPKSCSTIEPRIRRSDSKGYMHKFKNRSLHQSTITTRCTVLLIPQTVYCWGSILEKKSWPHSLAAPLNTVAGLCVQALSSSCPLWLGSVSRPCPLGRAPELCGWLCVQAVLLLSSSFGRAGEPCVFLLLILVATFSNPVGPPPLSSCHGRKPRVLLSLFVQVCLSWVCFHVAMNATVTQRSRCDITIGSSHDIRYPIVLRM